MNPDNGLRGAAGRHGEAAERGAGAGGRAGAAGPPFDPADLGLARHAVYLGGGLAIFVFEGQDVEQRVRALVNDPVRSASFAAWVPLLAGCPALAHEAYRWEADG